MVTVGNGDSIIVAHTANVSRICFIDNLAVEIAVGEIAFVMCAHTSCTTGMNLTYAKTVFNCSTVIICANAGNVRLCISGSGSETEIYHSDVLYCTSFQLAEQTDALRFRTFIIQTFDSVVLAIKRSFILIT